MTSSFNHSITNITSTTMLPKALVSFTEAYETISRYDTGNLRLLETRHYTEWRDYVMCVRQIISSLMHSSQLVKTSAKDKENNPVTTSNYQMVCSMRKSGFKQYNITTGIINDEILDDLLTYILLKTNHYMTHSDNAIDTYLLIKRSVTNKLIDMTRAMKTWLKKFPSNNNIISDEDGNETELEIEDSKVNIEQETSDGLLVNFVDEELIPKIIETLLPHPERLLRWLSDYAGMSCINLLNNINTYGYNYCLNMVVNTLYELENIDVRYLNGLKLNFKIPAKEVTRTNLDNWLYRARKDIAPLKSSFNDYVCSHKL